MRIVFTPMAHQDLRDIHDYVSDTLKNPEAAKSIIHKILLSCQRLGDFPNLGVSLQEKIERDTDYRCLFCGNYITFYTFEDNIVTVSRILDGRTDYMKTIFSQN